MSNILQEKRREEKLQRREESKRRYELRKSKREERDKKLKQAYKAYRIEVRRIWDWWHSLDQSQ